RGGARALPVLSGRPQHDGPGHQHRRQRRAPLRQCMETLLVSLLNGAIYGLLLFMVSAGLTLIFGMMGVLNFAHASFYMLGAYFAFALGGVLGFWGALAAAPLLVGLVGVVVER